ncbi:hypothetical protein [Clostridium felsineum]|uniref:Uncharacterized protein n=2 Tax=Clostridium felsineum TaxID=36839 RepID=A0A1S8LD97_9CLOT|nr:hypothetical protein [Clostridium felsineum]URZ05924.1 hypothetical protein CLROS_012560 [Clostridium felsineum]URZ10961.1 hypothetical protein CROST_016770 [Clostridium felsineum]
MVYDCDFKIGDSVIVARNTHPAFKNKKRFYKKHFIGNKATIIKIDERIDCFQATLKFKDEEIEKINVDAGKYLFITRDLDKI